MGKNDWSNYPRSLNSDEISFIKEFDKQFPEPKEDIRKEEIGGLETVLDKLQEFERGIQYGRLYEVFGSRPPRGFLLAGPPGYGKTLIAKYLASSLDARFVDLPLTKFESKWVGDAAKKLSTYISSARMYGDILNRKVLLFFDEAEESFKSRSSGGWHGPRVNVLLREMDGMSKDNNQLIFGGATNHIEKIDSALLRAGRLDYIIKIPEYNSKQLGQVFKAVSNRINRLAPYHNPIKMHTKSFEKLGEYGKQYNITPSDVNEVYRRTTDSLVQKLISDTYDREKKINTITINFKDVFSTLEEYCQTKDRKPLIGFNG